MSPAPTFPPAFAEGPSSYPILALLEEPSPLGSLSTPQSSGELVPNPMLSCMAQNPEGGCKETFTGVPGKVACLLLKPIGDLVCSYAQWVRLPGLVHHWERCQLQNQTAAVREGIGRPKPANVCYAIVQTAGAAASKATPSAGPPRSIAPGCLASVRGSCQPPVDGAFSYVCKYKGNKENR